MERTRPFLLDPGDSLLVATDIDATVLRLGDLTARTGIPADRFVVSPLASLPLPRYEVLEEGTLRFPAARADALWAPIFWIPDDIAQRMPVADPQGEDGVRGESDDEWAARIALHLVMAGLYRPESGEFVDVPAALGYDLHDPDVAARFQDWCDGAHDPDLDALDPAPLWRPRSGADDTVSVYFSLRARYPELSGLARYLGLDTVLGMLDEVHARRAKLDTPAARHALAYILATARLVTTGLDDANLNSLLDDTDANLAVAQTQDELLDFAIHDLGDTLTALRDHHQQHAERVLADGTDVAEEMLRGGRSAPTTTG